MLKITGAAFAGLIATVAPVQAAVIDYNVRGTFSNGSNFEGAFSFDDEAQGFAQFKNVILKVDGANLNSVYGSQSDLSSFYAINVATSPTGVYPIIFLAMDADVNRSGKIMAIKVGPLNRTYSKYAPTMRDIYSLTDGSISLKGSSAVPEPGTWAMMLLGFGATGYAMRRKMVLRYV